MEIQMDTREPEKMLSYLEQFNFRVIRKTLPVGDYRNESTIIERKTIPDFCGTIINGDLSRYCNDLLQTGKAVFWVFEEGKIRAISADMLYGAMASIVLRYGFPVIGPLPNDAICAYAIGSILSKTNKLGKPWKTKIRPNRKSEFIADIFRIPFDSAVKLNKMYGGQLDIIMKEIRDNSNSILKIKGIGKKRLARMQDIVSETNTEFDTND